MNTRTLPWAAPAAAIVLVLSGCGMTATAGSAKLTVPKTSTEVCNGPSYVREAAPQGVCGDHFDRMIAEQVDDDLSLGYLHQERMHDFDAAEVIPKAFDFMKKAKAENKPFFIWLNATRMHLYTRLNDKWRYAAEKHTSEADLAA